MPVKYQLLIPVGFLVYIFIMWKSYDVIQRFKETNTLGYTILIRSKKHPNELIKKTASQYLNDGWVSNWEEMQIMDLLSEYDRVEIKKTLKE